MLGRDLLQTLLLLVAMAAGPAIILAKSVMHGDGDDYPVVQKRASGSFVLITQDNVAASDLHLYNEKAPHQPAVEELARLGITCHFSNGATDTEPAAVTSILTGQLPSGHGVKSFRDRLDPRFMTLGRALARRSMRTAAFTNLPLFSATGLDAGFEMTKEDFSAGAVELARHASEWLHTLDDENHFLWIHYRPDPRVEDGRDAVPSTAFDTLVGHTIEAMQSARTYEGTFVVACGTFGRKGGHLMVPLIFKVPKRTAIGTHRTGPCSVIDIPLTVLDLFGMNGTIRGPGRSLISAPDKPLISGHYFPDKALFERYLPDNPNPILGLNAATWSITQGPKPGQLGLYNLVKDPGETVNLINTPDNKRAQDTLIAEFFDRKKLLPPPATAGRATLSEEATRQLKALGY